MSLQAPWLKKTTETPKPSEVANPMEPFAQTFWYHGSLSRHAAEVLLMLNGREGSFLLRKHGSGLYCISARTEGAVKHLKLEFSSSDYCFGELRFNSAAKVIDYFGQQPKIGLRRLSEKQNIENGTLVVMKYPYPAYPPEPERFDEIKTQDTSYISPRVLQSQKVTPMATKEGFAFEEKKVKGSKRRWLTCVRNELSLFETIGNKTPICIIDLTTARKCEISEAAGRGKHFTLECSNKTWSLRCDTEEETMDWVELLNFKIDNK